MNIKTTHNLPKKIRVQWDPTMQEDIRAYHVYRSSSINGGYELVAKIRDTSYVDTIVEDGANYFYRVSAVDKDGLESEYERNSIHGKTLVKPNAPAMAEARLKGSVVELVWRKTDTRTVSYMVERSESVGWLDKTTTKYQGIKSEQFIDRKLRPDAQYGYKIYSVDRDGILSNPSIEVKVVTPEAMKQQASPHTNSAQPQQQQREYTQPRATPTTDGVEEIIMPMENIDLSEI
jgi:fibronectin type 3 domain-containing protein